MAGRPRGRRGRGGVPAPAPRAGTRSTRQAAHEDGSGEEEQMNPSEGGIAGVFPPRRGAPAVSEVSIPTNRPDAESDAEGEVEEAEDRIVEERVAEEEEEQADPEDRTAALATLVFDVGRASNELWLRLKNVMNSGQPRDRVILAMKRRAFPSTIAEFVDPNIAPFINLDEMQPVDQHAGGQGGVITTLRKANLASALDIIEKLLEGKNVDKVGFLESLTKGVFPHHLTGDLQTSFSNDLLDIYTHLLIERLDADKGATPANSIIAEVFCRAEGDDFAGMFSHGPFVSLGGVDAEQNDKMVSDRITEVLLTYKKVKKGQGVAALRDLYKQAEFLMGLRDFMLTSWPQGPEADVFHDASESINIDGTSAFDSQELRNSQFGVSQRLTSGQTRYPSPPTRAGLAASADAAVAQSLVQFRDQDAAADDNDPEYQPDHRTAAAAIRNGKRAAPSSAPRQPKRQRISDANLPPSSMGPPSTAPPMYSTQPGAHPDFEAIKAKKRALSAQARAERPEGPTQQRKPWSAADCTTLLHCIFERHASWSQIQQEDSGRFEIPRNQQAYRDKARNMKVDYLITDAPLPPCFDLVALGSKEKDRLIAMGKNPSRREGDIDDNGMPVNTAYVPPGQEFVVQAPQPTQQQQPEQPQHHEPSQVAPEPQMG